MVVSTAGLCCCGQALCDVEVLERRLFVYQGRFVVALQHPPAREISNVIGGLARHSGTSSKVRSTLAGGWLDLDIQAGILQGPTTTPRFLHFSCITTTTTIPNFNLPSHPKAEGSSNMAHARYTLAGTTCAERVQHEEQMRVEEKKRPSPAFRLCLHWSAPAPTPPVSYH